MNILSLVSAARATRRAQDICSVPIPSISHTGVSLSEVEEVYREIGKADTQNVLFR